MKILKQEEMRIAKLITFFIIFFLTQIRAQDLSRVRLNIDTLTSNTFKGRGASGHGDSIASAWLQSQFKQIGLQKLQSSFVQNFEYPINTYPGTVNITIGKSRLKCGTDFIIRPESMSAKGKYKVIKLDTSHVPAYLQKKSKVKKALLIDGNWWTLHKKDPFKAEIVKTYPLILFTQKDKFTASLSTTQQLYTHIELSDSVVRNSKSTKMKVDIQCQFEKKHATNNIVGFIEGNLQPDSFLVISAHYDHLGLMGQNTYFPGANDNASGVSMLLELAKYYSTHIPKYSIIFIAFSAEEAGLIGSKYFVKNSPVDLKKIKFVVNLDMVGTGEAGIAVVNATVYEDRFAVIDSINKSNSYFTNIKKRGKAANSDHYSFTEANVPAFFIYTMGGIQAYHDVNDIAETLPLSHYTQVFQLVHQFLDTF